MSLFSNQTKEKQITSQTNYNLRHKIKTCDLELPYLGNGSNLLVPKK